MLSTVLMLILLIVTNREFPLSAQAVPDNLCPISDSVTATKLPSKEVTPCQPRHKN
jgi:hypothetical protein